jgi:hypothetical protein
MSRKTAIIRVAGVGDQHAQVQTRGRGRSVRSAATRALLNLLKQPPFRRQSAIHICIELVVVNSKQDQCASQHGSLFPRFA